MLLCFLEFKFIHWNLTCYGWTSMTDIQWNSCNRIDNMDEIESDTTKHRNKHLQKMQELSSTSWCGLHEGFERGWPNVMVYYCTMHYYSCLWKGQLLFCEQQDWLLFIMSDVSIRLIVVLCRAGLKNCCWYLLHRLFHLSFKDCIAMKPMGL